MKFDIVITIQKVDAVNAEEAFDKVQEVVYPITADKKWGLLMDEPELEDTYVPPVQEEEHDDLDDYDDDEDGLLDEE